MGKQSSKHLHLFIFLLLLYIGLGLPDSLLSTTWPDISNDLGVNVGYISLLSVITIFCSMISANNSDRLNRIFGSDRVIIVSMSMCMLGILIISAIHTIVAITIATIIMGSGAGAIDANVNLVASKHLKVGELNLLHGFWGIGITFTPLLTTIIYSLGYKQWMVYLIIGFIFAVLITYSILNKHLLEGVSEQTPEVEKKLRYDLIDNIANAIYFIYGVEFLIGTFLASYLTSILMLDSALAAFAVSCYWGGLMVSRLLMPLIFRVVNARKLLAVHAIVLIVASIVIQSSYYPLLIASFTVIGYSFGPIFPTFVHFTEKRHNRDTGYYLSKQIFWMYLAIFLAQVLVGVIAMYYSLQFFIYLVTIMIIIISTLILIYLAKTKNN